MVAMGMAGFFAPPTIAYVLSVTGGNWPITFYLSAGIYFAGMFCWFFIDPVTPLDVAEAGAA